MNNTLLFLIWSSVLISLVFFSKFIKKKEVKTFFSDGVSIDETKISLLMISFIIFIGISVWSVFTIGDIPDNVLYLTLGIGTGITGINMGNSSILRSRMYNQVVNDINQNPINVNNANQNPVNLNNINENPTNINEMNGGK